MSQPHLDGAAPPTSQESRPVGAPFVGRADELGRLLAAVSGAPALVSLAGDPGMGKSRLVSELPTAVPNQRVVVGRCHRLRDPFPLGPMAEVVRDLGADLVGQGLSPVAGALRPLVPELAEVLPPLADVGADRLTQRHLQFRGLVEVLRTVGRAVLVIEDAHWVDTQTLEFLDYLLDDPLPELSVVMTYRAHEVPPSVPALAARPREWVAVTRIELHPWDAAATGDLAAGILGVDHVSEELADHLCRRAAGIPLAVHELMALLLERGSIAKRDGEWIRRTIGELDVPAGVRDPVLERVGLLPDAARSLVEAAAVLQRPAPQQVLVDVADLTEYELVQTLQSAQRSGLLTEHDHHYELVHLLAAQAVYDALVPARRHELHRRAAAALQDRADPPLGQLAHHLRAAGQTDDWVDTAVAAGEQAWAAGDDAEVVRLLAPVLSEAPLDGRRRLQVAKALTRSAAYTAHARDVAEQVAPLLADEIDAEPAEGADLRLTVAILLSNTGGDADLLRALAGSAADSTALSFHKRVQGLDTWCRHPARDTSREDLLRVLDRAGTLIPDAPADEDTLFASTLVAAHRLALGDRRWRDRLRGDLLDRVPARLSEASAVYAVADAAYLSGHHALARRLAEACLAANDKRTMPPALVSVVRSLGYELDYWLGAWDGLEDTLREHLGRSAAGATIHERERAVLGALVLARSGPTPEVVDALDAVLDRAVTTGQLVAVASAVGPRARIPGTRAFAGLDALVDALEAGMVLPCMYRAVAPVTRMMLASGESDRAAAIYATMSRHALEFDAPLAAGAMQHADGHRAAHTGRWEDAASAYLAASARHDALLMPYEAAQAREDAARAMLMTSDPAAPRTLCAAIRSYFELGAHWDLDRASGLAREHGISVPARHRAGTRGYGSELSPREREVAELAAAGHTNREIAESLFLSVHTVNKHLSAALRKLGLTSRRQLWGHALAMSDQDTSQKWADAAQMGNPAHR